MFPYKTSSYSIIFRGKNYSFLYYFFLLSYFSLVFAFNQIGANLKFNISELEKNKNYIKCKTIQKKPSSQREPGFY